ncbi:MAG: hypothetical protein ABIH03_05800 [Pseudomonadota bacterium]
MHISTRLIALAGGVALSLGIAHAAPVAMVTDLQGSATMSKAKLALMAYIEAGTEIHVEAGAKLTLTYFAKAQEQTFSGPAKIRVQADKVEVLQGGAGQTRKLDPEKVSAAKKFEPAARDRMTVATFVMRSAPPRIALVTPVDTKVSAVTPEFSWMASKDASGYKLTLMDEQGQVLQQASVNGTSWKPGTALRYGRSYHWKLEKATDTGQTVSAQASFSVIDEEGAKRIAQHKPKEEAPFSERLLYAAQLENAGLKFEAVQQWRALAAERPQDPVLQKWAR